MEKTGNVKILLFLSPGLVFIVIFFVIPAIMTVAMSFTGMDYRLKWDFIGAANFYKITRDFLIPKIVSNTAIYVIGTLATFNLTLSLILAIFTTTIGRKSGVFYRAVWLLPRFTPPIVYGTMWFWILSPTENGLFNMILSTLGLQSVNWLIDYPLLSIVMINGFIGTSLGMLIFSSAIESIPENYMRAARVDGASWFQEVIYIIIPMIRWPLLFLLAYNSLSLLTSYEYIMIVTNGGPFYASEVWALYAYHQAFSSGQSSTSFQFGYGAALSVFLVVIGTIASILYWRVFKFKAMMKEPKIEIY
ncbi:sugar ABC transporter permease [Patescibacteria group bacterium]|nr:sugar ABC transporter permease [Patescibacteria group bacterium]